MHYTNIDDELDNNEIPDKNVIGGMDEVFEEYDRKKYKKIFNEKYSMDLSETFFNTHNQYSKDVLEKNLAGTIGNMTLMKVFFSDKNIARIQKLLIREIFVASKGKYLIESQNPDMLFQIMRSILLQNAKFTEDNLKGQIKCLNDLVVKVSAPDVLSNVMQYYKYLQDINEPLKPIARPISTNNRCRTLTPGFSTKILL